MTDKKRYVIILKKENLQKASQTCVNLGGKLADISDIQEQSRVEKLARLEMSAKKMHFWLGMTYQPSVSETLP